MLSTILLIVVGVAMLGLMFYSFFIVIFSKNKYDEKNHNNDKLRSTTERMRGKFVGRA